VRQFAGSAAARARYRSSGSLVDLAAADPLLANAVLVASARQPADGAPTGDLFSAEPLVLPPTSIRWWWALYCL